MKVFISWSGELSKQLAEALRNWLPATLQYVKPYFTPADIEKGAKWNDEVSKELEAAKVCIIALTRESLSSQWVMFEAGAISRGQTPVCAILFDIEPTDVQGPLESFQATKFSKKEILQLLHTINAKAEDRALDETTLKNVFEKWWPDLEDQLNEIIEAAKIRPKSQKVRDDRSLLEEAVGLTRAIAAEQREIYQALLRMPAAYPVGGPGMMLTPTITPTLLGTGSERVVPAGPGLLGLGALGASSKESRIVTGSGDTPDQK
jgi:hypothetical protein